MIIKVSYHIICSGICKVKGHTSAPYFKHNEDMVVCTLQFIAQYLIGNKVESVIEKNGCFPHH